MRVAIDAVGIRGHGGAAVLCELLQWLPISQPDWDWHVFLFERRLREFDDPVVSDRVNVEYVKLGDSGYQRLKWVNRHLPVRLQKIEADVLFSFANIAPTNAVTPQVVFCQQANAFFPEASPLRIVAKRARLWFMRRQILIGARASRAVIVQTDAMRERMEQMEPKLRGLIRTIPSGYRTPATKPIVRQRVREAVSATSHPRLIYVSHPSEHKNHLALVRALQLLARRKSAARLMLTLDRERPGDERYNGFVDQIRVEIDRLDVAEHVIWLGHITPDEVDFTLRSADLMVFPSMTESFGLGLVEAMAAGCPIAVSDLPYAHDVCASAAIYFDPTDSVHIAEVVLDVVENKDELARLKKVGVQRKTRFSYNMIAEEIAEVIQKSLAGTVQENEDR